MPFFSLSVDDNVEADDILATIKQDEKTIKNNLVKYFASMNNGNMSSASILVFNSDKLNASMENKKSAAYGSLNKGWKNKEKDEEWDEHYDDVEEIVNELTSTTTTTIISSLEPTTTPSIGSFTETKNLKIKHNPRCQTDVLSQLLPQNNNNNHLNSLQNKAYGSDVKDYKLNSLGLPYYDLHAINNELSFDSQTTKNKQIHNKLHQPQQHKSMKKFANNRYNKKDDFIRINNNRFNDQCNHEKPREIQQNALKDCVQTSGENLKRKY